MLVMVEEGRLGNQLFQYVALRSEARVGEKLILLGFDQLRSTFEGIEATFINIDTNPLKHLRALDYSRVIQLSSRIPGFGTVFESPESTPTRSGRRVEIVNPGWFQSPAYLGTATADNLAIKSQLREDAKNRLARLLPPGKQPAFVHVRAGDYRTWPTLEAPAILPVEWYAHQAQALSQQVPDAHFIGVGDDTDYVEEVMSNIKNSSCAGSGFAEEFSLMAECKHGVLSASSFAYWAALFARRESAAGIFIAPTFWAGHASESWYPLNIKSDFLTYSPVTNRAI